VKNTLLHIRNTSIDEAQEILAHYPSVPKCKLYSGLVESLCVATNTQRQYQINHDTRAKLHVATLTLKIPNVEERIHVKGTASTKVRQKGKVQDSVSEINAFFYLLD